MLQLFALYTAIVDHGYQWPTDYTIPERTVYYHIWHNNSILFKEQISQKIIRTSPNLVVRITVPRHAQFSYRALSLFNPIISEKRYDSTKPRFEEIEYTLSKEIKYMEYDPNGGYLGKISILGHHIFLKVGATFTATENCGNLPSSRLGSC